MRGNRTRVKYANISNGPCPGRFYMSERNEIDQLIELRRWAKYGRLLSGVIHNLNTPLMGITGRVELIGFKMPDLKGLDQISRQLERINDILVPLAYLVDKDLNVERGLCDVSDLIMNVHKLCGASMKYKHHIQVEHEVDEGLLADIIPSALQNALFEISMNAAEALSDEGELLIAATKSNGNILIRFENNGPPIPEDLLDRIDEIDTTTKKGGFGLGCAIARRGVEACGGVVRWANMPPGVVCVVELPAFSANY